MAVNMFHENKRKVRHFMLTPGRLAKWRRSNLEAGLMGGENLAAWLNRTPGFDAERSRALVLEAIRLVGEMNRLRTKGAPSYPDATRKGRDLSKAWRSLRSILDGLRPMTWSVLPTAEGYAVELENPTPLEAAFAELREVTQAGLLDRLQQCRRDACRRWFMAGRADKGFCSSDCQEEYWSEYRKTDAGRAKMAAAMRKWRAKQRRAKTKGRKRRDG
jgi:hypothetical protein